MLGSDLDACSVRTSIPEDSVFLVVRFEHLALFPAHRAAATGWVGWACEGNRHQHGAEVPRGGRGHSVYHPKEDKEGAPSLRSGSQEVSCDSRGSNFSEQFKWRQRGGPREWPRETRGQS